MSVLNRTYPIDVPAGESRVIPAGGTYVYCVEANQNLFRIAIDDVQEGVIAPGLGFEQHPDEEHFRRVRVVNDNATDLVATIVIGTGRILDNRLTIASAAQMQGIEGGTPVAVTSGQTDTYGEVVTSPGDVGERSFIALGNPAGSGILLLAKQIAGIAMATGPGWLYEAAYPGGGASALRWNFAAGASVGELWDNTLIGAPASGLFPVSTPITDFPEPIVITPGRSLVLLNDTTDEDLTACFVWTEVPE